MRKYLRIFVLLALSLCMISCQKSETNKQMPQGEDDTSKTTVDELLDPFKEESVYKIILF